MKVTISMGNTKIGRTMNVSLPPIVTCRKDAPCAKDCYAVKGAYRMYPGTRKAWDGNLAAYRENPDGYFWQIHQVIKRARNIKFFRWHVGGDIPDFDYLMGMVVLSAAYPDVQFLCFTKQYEIVEQYETSGKFRKNLNIVISAWPGLPLPKGIGKHRPIAWMNDCRDPDKRIPKAAKKCPGKCTTCGLCWELPRGKSVVFNKH